MNPEKKRLWESVLRQTRRDAVLLGHWLWQHRRSARLTPRALARQLGVPLRGLIVLSLCRTPRDDHFQEDLAVVCERSGANLFELARLLRQEQGLARMRAQAAPAQQGWLLAASDRSPPEPPDEPVKGEEPT